MGPVVETVFYPARPNIDPSPILAEISPVLARQPGFRSAYYGTLVEDEKIHCLVLEWADKAAVEAWAKPGTDAYRLKDRLMTVVNSEGGLDPFIST
jgi:heme-degrading monooxygenase HmoA